MPKRHRNGCEAGLLKAKETLSTAQEDAQKAALEAQEALQHLEAAHLDIAWSSLYPTLM